MAEDKDRTKRQAKKFEGAAQEGEADIKTVEGRRWRRHGEAQAR